MKLLKNILYLSILVVSAAILSIFVIWGGIIFVQAVVNLIECGSALCG